MFSVYEEQSGFMLGRNLAIVYVWKLGIKSYVFAEPQFPYQKVVKNHTLLIDLL